MVAEGDEEVKEELAASVVHLELHGAASLEGAAAADDEGEVVGAQLGVGIGGVGIGVAGGGENSAALDARFLMRCQESPGMRMRIGWRHSRRPCFRRATFFSSSSPYFSAAQ